MALAFTQGEVAFMPHRHPWDLEMDDLKDDPRIHELSEMIRDEQDSEKLSRLAEELARVLDEHIGAKREKLPPKHPKTA